MMLWGQFPEIFNESSFLNFLFYIEAQLINSVLVSGVQQSDSVRHFHVLNWTDSFSNSFSS